MCSTIPNGESISKQDLLLGFRSQLIAKIDTSNTGITTADLSYVYFCDFYNLWNEDTGLDVLGNQCYTLINVDGVGKLHANPYGQELMSNSLMSVITTNEIADKMLKTR